MADGLDGRTGPLHEGGAALRYSAFISYSHADSAFARKLHRQLEGYRLPNRALIQASRSVRPNGRLKPLFRDEDELPAAHDLTEAVREAIHQSEDLIVVCSPNAAASPWVAREIELFRERHGPSGIVAALADDEPAAAFPPALTSEGGVEPLAADFRGDASDRRLALLRLVAVLAGVPLDALIQRDAQRRMKGLAIAAAASVAVIAVVAGLSTAAFNAQRDAEAQRARAGGLGEFMLSDLRKGLEGAGRHDLLAQVDQAALKALSTDISRLTPDQLLQRATLLQGMAKDAEKAGDLKAAHASAQAALATTTALLAAKPNDPKRLFAHAQSEYWMGFVSWREGNGEAAKASYEAYARLADRLVATEPSNDAWRMERVYAAHNLGGLTLRQAGDARLAESYLRASLAELDLIVSRKPDDPDALAERQADLAWLADSQRLQGHLQDASASRRAQYETLQRLLAKNPRSVEVKRQLLGHELAVARIAAAEGADGKAIALLRAGRARALELAREDPDNKDFPKQARMFELFETALLLELPFSRQPPSAKIAQVLGDCAPTGSGADNLEISDFCSVLLARFRRQQGDAVGAAAALVPVHQHAGRRHDVLTARWGLNLAAEARPVQTAGGAIK